MFAKKTQQTKVLEELLQFKLLSGPELKVNVVLNKGCFLKSYVGRIQIRNVILSPRNQKMHQE